METVLITGGTGLIGSALSRRLVLDGYRVIILTRRPLAGLAAPRGCRYAHWDPAQGMVDEEALAAADHLIHLAGANVAERRWTEAVKREIAGSRVDSTLLLFEALAGLPPRPGAFLCASATGYYGQSPDFSLEVSEDSPPAAGFLGRTCQAWEAAALRMASLGRRVVLLRTGIVLSREDGMLPRLMKPLRLGVLPVLGHGGQWVSWIHLRDLVEVYVMALRHAGMQGPYNAVSPFPVTQRQLSKALARAMARRRYLPLRVPGLLLRMLLGEMGQEITGSCRASAGKLLSAGFSFSFPAIDEALADLVQHPAESSAGGLPYQ